MVLSYVRNTARLAAFYVRYLPLLRCLPQELRDPDSLAKRLRGSRTPFDFVVKSSDVATYNGAYADLKDSVRADAGPRMSFTVLMALFFAVRIATVAAAVMGDLHLALKLSLLQFVVAPYSFFVSLTMLVALAPPLFVGHYASFVPMRWLANSLLPDALNVAIPVTWPFIAAFFVVDQGLCSLCLVWTPDGPSDRGKSVQQVLASVVYGFFNCKTYFLVLLCLLRAGGAQLHMGVWALDAALGISQMIARLVSKYGMHWAALFYHQHRIAHLPQVYEHAHKFHHYLHGTTAFDAHIYGSGAPEEWHTLMLELLPSLWWGINPASLNHFVLYTSWTNKTGHTRKQKTTGGNNAHADHHTHHNKNFGIFYMTMDMVFGTCTNNSSYQCAGWTMTKSERGGTITMAFAPVERADDAARASSLSESGTSVAGVDRESKSSSAQASAASVSGRSRKRAATPGPQPSRGER